MLYGMGCISCKITFIFNVSILVIWHTPFTEVYQLIHLQTFAKDAASYQKVIARLQDNIKSLGGQDDDQVSDQMKQVTKRHHELCELTKVIDCSSVWPKYLTSQLINTLPCQLLGLAYCIFKRNYCNAPFYSFGGTTHVVVKMVDLQSDPAGFSSYHKPAPPSLSEDLVMTNDC